MEIQSHKDRFVGLRLTEEEKDRFVRQMSAEGYNSRSRYLRDCIFKHETSVFIGSIEANREVIRAIKENTAAVNKFGSLINTSVKRLNQIRIILTSDDQPVFDDDTDVILNCISESMAGVRDRQAKLVEEIRKSFPCEKR